MLAELFAKRMGLQLAKHMKITHLEINSDSITAINLILEGKSNVYSYIIDICRQFLQQISRWTLTHLYRETNNLRINQPRRTPACLRLPVYCINLLKDFVAILNADKEGKIYERHIFCKVFGFYNEQTIAASNFCNDVEGTSYAHNNIFYAVVHNERRVAGVNPASCTIPISFKYYILSYFTQKKCYPWSYTCQGKERNQLFFFLSIKDKQDSKIDQQSQLMNYLTTTNCLVH